MLTQTKAFEPADPNFGLEPNHLYSKYSKEAQQAWGLKQTAINDAIERGDITPPFQVTEGGRLRAWFGWQLIAAQQERLERQRRESKRLAAIRPSVVATNAAKAAAKRQKRGAIAPKRLNRRRSK
jgi:hypothetical protein